MNLKDKDIDEFSLIKTDDSKNSNCGTKEYALQLVDNPQS